MKPHLIVPLVVLSACASVPQNPPGLTPEWVNHPEVSYPSLRFLTSVGVGRDRDDAIRDAKKQMSESFLTKVQSVTRVNANSTLSENTKGGVSGESAQGVTKEVTLASNARLRGAEVKEVASIGSDTYVLLALDKLAARSAVMMEMTRLQSRVSGALDELESGFQYQKARDAKADLESLRELSSEASALGTSAGLELNSLEARMQRLDSQIRAKNEKLKFFVKTVTGDERFSKNIEVCLQDHGASIFSESQASEPTYRVEVSVLERPQHFAVEGWVKTRYEISVNLVSPAGRSYRVTGQKLETARSKESGLESAANELSETVCEQLWNRLGELK